MVEEEGVPAALSFERYLLAAIGLEANSRRKQAAAAGATPAAGECSPWDWGPLLVWPR